MAQPSALYPYTSKTLYQGLLMPVACHPTFSQEDVAAACLMAPAMATLIALLWKGWWRADWSRAGLGPPACRHLPTYPRWQACFCSWAGGPLCHMAPWWEPRHGHLLWAGGERLSFPGGLLPFPSKRGGQ